MASVPNGVETLWKNFNRLSRVHERYRQTYDRQTRDRRTGDDIYSEREREFTLPKNGTSW